MRFAGFGFGSQRPSRVDESHICGWNAYYGDRVENLRITNNVFDCSTSQIVNWGSGSDTHTGFVVKGNTFYQNSCGKNPVMNFSKIGKIYANNSTELNKAISVFDSSPKLVKWLG